ncbi:hypothetical protein P256_00867 [Acinetobacter nectaris CIP 110549]|uniref:Internalin n=1 Tax=Acinetobacter nectaris CIP 110549 TaxID=1392540 RepID=V2TXF0_9GAMM|nr:hypothetical protein [Acinetobacter nectaris]ESK40415.1 hypothetical protein P256_00867 [Acinetobacter nectaris CIP 110549]MCF9045843.1 internalin [Acinetobacter nectaris]
MMNKKLLICGVIMAGLVLTACSKKEAPQNNDKQEQATSQNNVASEQLQSINKDTPPAPMAEPEQQKPHETVPPEHHSELAAEKPPKMVEVEKEQTANTTTEIRREYKSEQPKVETTANVPVHPEQVSTSAASPAPEVVKPKHHHVAKPQSTNANLSEDDAVAAAMSAAKPALN